METIFRLPASQLDISFIDSIKALFKEREVEITVTDQNDETAYLLSDSESRKNLLEALDDIKENRNLVSFSGKEFETFSEELLSK